MASEQYAVGGMSCSFCAETIEKALSRTDGVEDVDVSLAHEEVLVRYDADRLSEVEVTDTLRDLGYTIRSPEKAERFEQQQAELDRGRRRLLAGSVASGLTGFLMVVMVARSGWNVFAEADAAWMSVLALGLALGTMFGPGRYIKGKAYNSLRRGILNQHVLLEAGAFAGLLGGALGLAVWPEFPTVHFFAVATFITTYHILSEYTSLVVRSRASQAVAELLDLRPDTARRIVDGEPEEVPVDALAVGDRVRVKPGETVPVDGVVVDGTSAVDESVATGESAPVDKVAGDDVVGGSVNETGTLLVEVTATGEDAFLDRVARQVEEARAMKPGIVKLADRVLRYFVPGVLAVATLAGAFWTVVPAIWPAGPFGAGPQLRTGAFAALAVLVLGYPCALGMATPLALVRGGGEAATRGILLRSGDAFQAYRNVDRVVLDKTGTITEGKPAVDTVVALGDYDEAAVLGYAASAEAFSEHPLADAVLEYAHERDLVVSDPEAFESVPGNGVRATVDGDAVLVGKPGWLEAQGVDLATGRRELDRLQRQGLTVSCVVVREAGTAAEWPNEGPNDREDATLVGVIGIGDELTADAAQTVDRLQDAGMTPTVITGDGEATARAVADAVGIERVMADVLPEEKRAEIRRLQERGQRVAMVGDGINDAPALTQADVGIAVGAGTDIAIESADIVLVGDRLGGVVDAHSIAETSYRKTRQNLAAAFAFNGLGVAAATTGLVHPVFAMLAMVLSVTAVLANSFAGQLVTGDGVTTRFTVEESESAIGD